MPTLDENLRTWDSSRGWADADAGERWSDWWGGAEAQWRFCLLPRISAFLPAPTVLEIAPGFGRWTQFLQAVCERLIVVDLSQRCIEACRHRFKDRTHISYFVNDGRSLDMVADGSVDFVFSFDSLVHADADVIEAYIAQLARKLAPHGVCFIHHSNWGAYRSYAAAIDLIPGRRLKKGLARLGLIEGVAHWRARDMTAVGFEKRVMAAGLQCIGQELVNWKIRRLSDCISTFTRPTSRWARSNVLVRNPQFTLEAAQVRRVAPAYSHPAHPG